MTDLVYLLDMVLDVVDPMPPTLEAPPDPSLHGSSGHLRDYKNSPQFNTTQSSFYNSPLFPEVGGVFVQTP